MKPLFRFGLRLAAIMLVAVAVIVIVFPVFAGRLGRAGWLPERWESWLPLITVLQTRVMQAFVLVWFFFLGSCFASFLNVVAWRVPRGRGINGSSHCPYCDVKLSMTDNIPIVGWLWNQGQCRTCRAPISPRYLLVEILLGAVTLALVSLEVFWAGINLPGFPFDSFSILDHLILDQRVDLLWMIGCHLVLIYSLFTMAVVRSERLAIPASIAICGGMILLGAQPS